MQVKGWGQASDLNKEIYQKTLKYIPFLILDLRCIHFLILALSGWQESSKLAVTEGLEEQ